MAWETARRTKMPWSTVSGILRREGLGRLALLNPKEPARRYERWHEGQLVRFDVKPLGRWRKRPGHRAAMNPSTAGALGCRFGVRRAERGSRKRLQMRRSEAVSPYPSCPSQGSP